MKTKARVAPKKKKSQAIDECDSLLKENNRRFKEAQHLAHFGNWELNHETKILTWSDEIYRIFEIDKKKLGVSYEVFLAAVHPEDRQKVDEAYVNSIKNHKPYEIAHRLLMPDGRIKYVREQGITHYDLNNQPTCSAGVVADITQSKKSELALAERNKFVESLVSMTPDILYIYDLEDKKNVYINDGVQRMLGYSIDEIQAMGDQLILNLMHPDDFSKYQTEIFPRYSQVKDQERIVHEYRMKDKAGNWRWLVSNEVIYLRNSAGLPKQIFGMIHDLTDEKATEKTLRENELKTRSLLDLSFEFMGLLTPEGVLVDVNKTALDFIGVKAADVTGKFFWDTPWWSNSEKTQNQIKEAISSAARGALVKSETEHIAKDGAVRIIDFTVRPVFDEQKQVVYLIPEGRDVTEQKQTEHALRENEKILKESQKIAGIGSYVFDAATGSWTSSQTLDEIFGIDSTYNHNIEGWEKLIFPEDRQMMADYFKNDVLGLGHNFKKDYRIVRANDQEVRWLSALGKLEFNASGEVQRMVGTIQDITNQKKVEEKLRNSLALVEATLESTSNGILVIDVNGAVAKFNNKFIEMWHIPLNLITIGKDEKLLEFVANQLVDPEVFTNKVKELYSNPLAESFDLIRFKDDRVFERVSKPMIASDGKPIARVWSFHDITERVKSEVVMQSLKDRDEAILSSIGDAVFAVDLNGIVVLFNKVAESLTGFSANEAMGKHFSQSVTFVNEADGQTNHEFIALAIAQNKITEMANHVVIVNKNGKRIPVADSAAPIRDRSGNILGCVVVFHDVAREREIDRAKTEFVSLASHQLRTPLTALNWYSEMLLSEKAGNLNSKQQSYVREIAVGSKRMGALMNALLNVSRIELGIFMIDSKPVNLVEIAKTCLRELNLKIFQKKLTFEEEYDPNLLVFQGDAGLMTMIFSNLLSNAIKYSREAGHARLAIKQKNDQIIVEVSDDGIGIPKYQQDKVFSKLFRADNVEAVDADGTGLGLYIIKEIIDHSGGKIWFESSDGQEPPGSNSGTTFFVSFPVSGMIRRLSEKKLV